MKFYSILFLLLLKTTTLLSQTNKVEKSLFTIQTGVLGFWVNYEAKLTNDIALRSEIGLDTGFWAGYQKKTGFYMTPVISLEPRYYYNFDKRITKNRNTQNNSANFICLEMTYHPDAFVISNYKNLKIYNQVSIIPKWGLKRNIGKGNFNYEFDIGIGYRYYFLKQYDFIKNEGKIGFDTSLRIGYTFTKKKNEKK